MLKNNLTESLLKSEAEQLEKLKEIVHKTIEEEKLILDNLQPDKNELTTGQLISDKIARFGGSWGFIFSFFFVLTVWVIYNIVATSENRFDPYPFILMNLVLSCIAAIQAPIIMMSQNRQEEKDRMRSENDYLINLKAELEIRTINQKIDSLLNERIEHIVRTQLMQMQLLEQISDKLKKKDSD